LTEFKEAIENGTVLANTEALHLFAVVVHVVRPGGAQKLDVIVAVELGQLLASGLAGPIKSQFCGTGRS